MKTSSRFFVGRCFACLAVSALLWAAPTPGYATDRGYTYGEAFYSNTNGFDGYGGSGSFGLGNNFRITGGGSLIATNGLNLRTFSLGAGYIARLSSFVDLVVDAGFLNIEDQFFFIDAGDDEWGGFGALTLRLAAADNVDIEPSISYVKFFDIDFGDDDQLVYGVTARYWFGNRFAVEVGVADSKEARDPTFSVGMRFGRKKR